MMTMMKSLVLRRHWNLSMFTRWYRDLLPAFTILNSTSLCHFVRRIIQTLRNLRLFMQDGAMRILDNFFLFVILSSLFLSLSCCSSLSFTFLDNGNLLIIYCVCFSSSVYPYFFDFDCL